MSGWGKGSIRTVTLPLYYIFCFCVQGTENPLLTALLYMHTYQDIWPTIINKRWAPGSQHFYSVSCYSFMSYENIWEVKRDVERNTIL